MVYTSENLRDYPLTTVFSRQKSGAKVRKIQWDLTFDQWLEIWTNSGMLWNRGKGVGESMMCRRIEPSPYSVKNVYIGDGKTNQADMYRNLKDSYLTNL